MALSHLYLMQQRYLSSFERKNAPDNCCTLVSSLLNLD